MRSPPFWFAPTLFVVASLLACSAKPRHDTEGAVTVPGECQAFLASLDHCLKSLGPADIASARVAQARASLDGQLAHGEAARATVRQQCATSLAQMKCR